MRLPRTARKAVRVKGKKGKAGSDGRSSLANPKSSRYRKAAVGRIGNVGTLSGSLSGALDPETNAGPGLTQQMLSQFDAEQREKVMDAMSLRLDPLKDEEESVAGGALTFRSIASNFTQCSNPSFERVLRAWSGNSQQQNSVLSVLAGLTQVIKEKGGSGTNVEYFALLVNALETFVETGEVENVAATAFLLKLIIGRVPVAVLRKEFSRVSRTLCRVLSDPRGAAGSSSLADAASVSSSSHDTRHQDAALTKATLAAIGVLLRAQNWSTWGGAATRAVFQCLLRFVVDSRAKIRKAAHLSVVSVLKSGEKKGTPHVAGSDAVRCLLSMITVSPANGESPKKVLWALALLGSILPYISATAVQEACEMAILPLMAQPSQPLVRLHSIRALHGLFAGFPSEERLPADKNAKLLTALYEMRPPKNSEDIGTMKAWMTTARAGLYNLLKLGRSRLVAPHLTRLFPLCMDVLSSPVPGMHAVAGHSALRLLDDVLKVLLERTEAKSDVEGSEERLGAVETDRLLLCLLNSARSSLNFQFITAWPQVLKLMAGIISVWGKATATGDSKFWSAVESGEFGKELILCLRQLVAMRDERVESKAKNETIGGENVEADLERILGVAVQAMGMMKFIKHVPLLMKGRGDSELNLTRSWVLPLLLSHGASSHHKASLKYFFEELRPIADDFNRQKEEATAELVDADRPGARVKLLDTLFIQIWRLLPVFCSNPAELYEETFVTKDGKQTPTMVMALHAIVRRLEQWKDLRRILVTSIRRLVACEKRLSAEWPDCPRLMRKYAKNVLPVLFNMYLKTADSPDGVATIDAVRSYAEVAPEELVLSLYTSARKKVEQEKDEAKMRYELDILVSLVPHLPEAQMREALDSCLTQIRSEEQSPSVQKKAYRMLQVITASENETARRVIDSQLMPLIRILSDAQELSQETSLKPRLRVIAILLNRMKEKLSETDIGQVKDMTKQLLAEVQLSMRAMNSEARRTARLLLTQLAHCWHEVHGRGEEEDELATTLSEVQSLLTAGVAQMPVSDTSEDTLHLCLVTINALSSLLQEPSFRTVVNDSHVRNLVDFCSGRLLCSSNLTLARTGLISMKEVISSCSTNSLPLDAFMSALDQVNEAHRHSLRFDVKALLIKLMRRVGATLILELIPEYLRFPFVRMARTELRQSRKADRRKKAQKEEAAELGGDEEEMEAEVTESGMLPKLRQPQTLDELLEDSDSDEVAATTTGARRIKKRKASGRQEEDIWLEEEPGEVLDLLATNVAGRIHTKAPVTAAAAAGKKAKEEFPVAEDGRMIICDPEEDHESESESEPEEAANTGKGATSVRPWRRKKAKETPEPGAKFRSMKALGDMKRGKGPDPFAYLKLRGVSKKDIAVLMKKKKGKGVLGKGKHLRSRK